MPDRFFVPKRWHKGAWQSGIRTKLEQKYPDERVRFVYITPEKKCLATLEKPTIIHDNPYHRIEFETETHQLEFQVVPRKCAEVMEG